MNKSQLINQVATISNISKIQAGRIINTIISSVTESLKKGNEVVLVGFGTFTIRERPARIGRNPKTGQVIKIAAAKVPIFRAGKFLKETVNFN